MALFSNLFTSCFWNVDCQTTATQSTTKKDNRTALEFGSLQENQIRRRKSLKTASDEYEKL